MTTSVKNEMFKNLACHSPVRARRCEELALSFFRSDRMGVNPTGLVGEPSVHGSSMRITNILQRIEYIMVCAV